MPMTPTARPMRAWLFVPANRPDRFAKALSCGADAVIFDLEDAVAPANKAAARHALGAWLASLEAPPGVPLWLRLNAADTAWFADDLALLAGPALAGAMLPKTETAEMIDATREAGARAVLPLVETAAGFDRLRDIAAAAGVERLAFGSIDLQVDLGMRDATEDELLWFRTQMVLASRLAGIAPPVDGVSTAIDHEGQIRDDSLRARRLGFAGKLCIHPKQVTSVRQYFAPSASEIAWARKVLAADAAAAGAAVSVDGKMVDKPVILRAQAILDEAALG